VGVFIYLCYINLNKLIIMAQLFRKTWRHEVSIKAETPQEAQAIWEALNLGHLNKEYRDGTIVHHDWVEDTSFEDENQEEVNLN
jgi:hypothetical protein